MGAFLDKPKTEKYHESGSGPGLAYGLSAMQGWRVEMEDAHSVDLAIPDLGPDVSWFAVFDGHAGSRVSTQSAQTLLSHILATGKLKRGCDLDASASSSSSEPALSGTNNKDADVDPWTSDIIREIEEGITEGFLEQDSRLRALPEVVSGQDKSGSTSVCALLTPGHIVFANCGDSRAVLSDIDGNPTMATVDHKPSIENEWQRVVRAGGTVMMHRVNGVLAVSRGLGDFEYKKVEGLPPGEQLVSPVPEYFVHRRNRERDAFIILACDGVWDVMSNADICQFVASRMRLTSDLEAIADEVIDTCLHKGSRDNMSIIIIALESAPKVSTDEVAKDAQLVEKIKSEVTDIVKENDYGIDIQAVVDHVKARIADSDLPPGGGLFAKKKLIDDTFASLMVGKRDADSSGHLSTEIFRNPLAALLHGRNFMSVQSNISDGISSDDHSSSEGEETEDDDESGDSRSNDSGPASEECGQSPNDIHTEESNHTQPVSTMNDQTVSTASVDNQPGSKSANAN